MNRCLPLFDIQWNAYSSCVQRIDTEVYKFLRFLYLCQKLLNSTIKVKTKILRLLTMNTLLIKCFAFEIQRFEVKDFESELLHSRALNRLYSRTCCAVQC